MRQRLTRALRLAVLVSLVAVAGLGSGAAWAAPDQGKITLKFDDVDINAVVKFISELKGINFILDDAVKGKVTIISPVPVTVNEAYEIFLSVLEVKGFAAVPSGKVVKIIPAAEAKEKRMPTATTAEGLSSVDETRTQLIQLENISASQVVPLIKPLIAKTSHVEAFDSANTLLITEVESNIKRILDIIAVIDTPGFQQQLELIPLRYATADKLASQITSIFGATTGQATAPRTARRGRVPAAPSGGLAETEVKVFADERTNALIVFATRNDLAKVKGLVEQLDVPPPPDNSRVRIYHLQHTVAEELANVLTGVVSSMQAVAEGDTPQTAAAARAAAAAQRAAAAARGGGGSASPLGDRVSIIPDPANNALVITAAPEDHAIVEAIIKELDIQPQQVYVEALIVEVALDSTFSLGVEWRALGTLNDNGVVLGSSKTTGALDGLAAITTGTVPTIPTGLALGFLGDTIEFNGVELPGLGALITALKGASGANIISTPQILTLNNQEAEFNSVLTIPFQTGTSTGTGVNVVSTFDFRDVGTILKITPHINKEGYVRMEVSQEVSTVQDSSTPGLPTTSKRSANTTVVVKNGHTVVIGGLIGNQFSRGQTKVPLLGDIPLLGALFRETRETSIKTNLLIFISPHVINRAEELSEFTDRRRDDNPLLEGEPFKKMMDETFPRTHGGILGSDRRPLSETAIPWRAQEPVTTIIEPGGVAPEVATPAVTPEAMGAPAVPQPPMQVASPPPTGAERDLTERLRRVLTVPAAEAAPVAPLAQPSPAQAPPVPVPATGEEAPAATPAPPPPATEGDLMEQLQQILGAETPASIGKTGVSAPPAVPEEAAEDAAAAPPATELREVEQPLFEAPRPKGWFSRMKERLTGGEGVRLDESGDPETSPDAVSPIYRYTPDGDSSGE
jgi:general secretion pathway protein D